MASLPALYFGLKERRKSQQNQSVPRSRRDAGIGNVLGEMQEKESHPFRRKNYSLLFRGKGIQLSLCDAHLSVRGKYSPLIPGPQDKRLTGNGEKLTYSCPAGCN